MKSKVSFVQTILFLLLLLFPLSPLFAQDEDFNEEFGEVVEESTKKAKKTGKKIKKEVKNKFKEIVEEETEEKSEWAQNAADDADDYLAGEQDESYVFNFPTSRVMPEGQALRLQLYFKSFSDADVTVPMLRYDMTLIPSLQLGLESKYDYDSNRLHSSYLSIKAEVVESDISPVGVSIGVKGRLYWNENNLDYQQGFDTDETNDKLNKRTLFLATSGNMLYNRIFANFYIDNQSYALSAKGKITPEIHLITEVSQTTYENALSNGTRVIGAEFNNFNKSKTTFVYDNELEKFLLDLSYLF